MNRNVVNSFIWDWWIGCRYYFFFLWMVLSQHEAVGGWEPWVVVASFWLSTKLGQVGNHDNVGLMNNSRGLLTSISLSLFHPRFSVIYQLFLFLPHLYVFTCQLFRSTIQVSLIHFHSNNAYHSLAGKIRVLNKIASYVTYHSSAKNLFPVSPL